jgi:hypothetical protein
VYGVARAAPSRSRLEKHDFRGGALRGGVSESTSEFSACLDRHRFGDSLLRCKKGEDVGDRGRGKRLDGGILDWRGGTEVAR